MNDYEQIKHGVLAVVDVHEEKVVEYKKGLLSFEAIRYQGHIGVRVSDHQNSGILYSAALSWEENAETPKCGGPLLKVRGSNYKGKELDLSIDDRVAFRDAATRLISELTGIFNNGWRPASDPKLWNGYKKRYLATGLCESIIDVVDRDEYYRLVGVWEQASVEKNFSSWAREQKPLSIKKAIQLGFVPCGTASVCSWQVGIDVANQYSDRLHTGLTILDNEGNATTKVMWLDS